MNKTTLNDVRLIMEAAAKDPRGIVFRVATYGKAVNLRMLCYRWRKQQRELEKERLGEVPGLLPQDPYGTLVITLEQPLGIKIINKADCNPAKPVDVVIQHAQIEGQALDMDGNPIELENALDDEPNTYIDNGLGLDYDADDS